jgi:hypothetical protein
MSLSPSDSAVPLSTGAIGSAELGGGDDDRLRVQQLYRQHSLSLVRQLTRKTGRGRCELSLSRSPKDCAALFRHVPKLEMTNR